MTGVLARVAAVVVAVALVVGAVAYRAGREGSDDGELATPDATDEVACPTELAALCRGALGGSVRAASTSVLADELTLATTGVAVLPAAWADLVDDARSRAGRPPLERSEVVASTPLLLVAFEDRAAVLAGACGGEIQALTWSCVGEQAGTRWEDLGGDVRWGTVVLGHLSPDTATGLQATTGIIAARTGLPFSLAELRDPAFGSWFRQLERAVASHTPAGGSHLTAMVTRGPSAANVAVATEAETTQRDLATAFGPIVAVPAEPMFLVELVVVGTDDDPVSDVAATLTSSAAGESFADAGWRTDGAAPAGTSTVDLPAAAPSPSGGVLTAVRSVWTDVAG